MKKLLFFSVLFLFACAHLPASLDKVQGKPASKIMNWGADARTHPILDKTGKRLARATKLGEDYYQFKLALTLDINACTIKGGYIYVFLGMIETLETEEELAAVLAHEIAHNEKRHLARIYDWEFPLHIIGEIVPIVTLGIVPNPIYLALSRKKEYEADTLGVILLAKAGYNPKGMEKIMEKFVKIYSLGYGCKYFRTHPPSKERLEYIRKAIASLPDELQKMTRLPFHSLDQKSLLSIRLKTK